MSLLKPTSFSYNPATLFFSNEKSARNLTFTIPSIVISPPDKEKFNDGVKATTVKVGYGNKEYSSLRTTKIPPPPRTISSLSLMPRLLKAPQPVQPMIDRVTGVSVMTMGFEAGMGGCIDALITMINAHAIVKNTQDLEVEGDRRRGITDAHECDQLRKAEFELYVSKACGDRQAASNPPHPIPNEAFSDDTEVPVFTTPVFNPSPSSTPPPKCADTWEPKTVVIDVEKLMQPPVSVSPFRYCAMMMNAEIVATENGSNVIGSDEHDACLEETMYDSEG
ncbi:hypothetical protein CVT24_003670 [Panaeolus cyanescens]|uniref:Uncharacterized protein n=1 Tax=Panaeolus cyanescens TaxID=181874 RepID=A0A409W8D9_9AGAR|nr:hypothetical protein CVT24_003670 [Panaeolus cyanescens]